MRHGPRLICFFNLIGYYLLSQQFINLSNVKEFEVLKESAIGVPLHYITRHIEPLFWHSMEP